MSRPPTPHRTDLFVSSPRTPGSLGRNDAADPNTRDSLKGPTPGSLGVNDHADPAHLFEVVFGRLAAVARAELIKLACDRAYNAYKGKQPCNEYVRAVGSTLPFPLPKVEVPNELADGIVETLRRDWRTLDAEEAISVADKGAFVTVALHSS